MLELQWYAPYGEFYPQKQARLLCLWDYLGIPHAKKKQIYGRSIKIIGFQVSLDDLSIAIDDTSRQEHARSIRAFILQRQQPLFEWQRLLGWMNWFLNVDPLLRPALQSSYAKIRGKSVRNAPIPLNKSVRKDLHWFADQIEASNGIHLLEVSDWEINDADLHIWTDASGFGLGFYCLEDFVGFQAERFPFKSAAGAIFYFEALTVVSALEWACARLSRPKRVVIYCDNTNTVSIFHKLSADTPYNDILFYSIQLRRFYGVDLRVVWTPGKENPIADGLSRFDLEKVHRHAPGLPIFSFSPPRLPLGAAQL